MAHDNKAIINGRGEVQTLDPRQQADLLRALVDRTTRNATPAARRRAIALAGVRVARAAEATQRGKA
jgi:hypothetical protein